MPDSDPGLLKSGALPNEPPHLLMYSALLPVGQRYLPTMTDSPTKSQKTQKKACHAKGGRPAIPETKPEGREPRGQTTNEEKDRKAGLFQQLKIARTRSRVPDHSCPPPQPPPPLPTQPPLAPPLLLSLADQQVDP